MVDVHCFFFIYSQIDAAKYTQTVDMKSSNPDLIREYLMRIRQEPPPIFQPTAMTTYNPLKALQQTCVNMAYKHPQLLIGEQADDCEKIDLTDRENITENNYNDRNQSQPFNLFNGNNHSETVKGNSDCHLIGNVKPNLIKTWEQLNNHNSQSDDMHATHTMESNETLNAQPKCIDSMLYFRNNHVLFDEKIPTTSKNNESFVIKRSASQSGHFYDSIDNESIQTQDDDDDQIIASLCDEIGNGGEAMAEYISLMEKKEKLCWSIDSCN